MVAFGLVAAFDLECRVLGDEEMKYPNGRRAPKNDGSKSYITVIWSHEPRQENELTYFWRNRDDYVEAGISSCRRDTSILMSAIEGTPLFSGKTLKQELIERGYDISTLKFSIEKLPGSSPC